MSEVITTAGAAGTGEQTPAPTEQDRVAAAVAKMTGAPAPAPAPTPAPAPEEPKQGSLAEAIRQQRQEREAARQAKSRSSTLEQELQLTKAEMAKLKGSMGEFEADPVGYAKARGWSKEQQLLLGQALLYDLAPDKADPEFRYQMFEMKQEREKRQVAKEAEEKQAKEEAAAQRRLAEDFFNETAAAVTTFEAGSYPESEAWFGDDAQAYMQSLMATANNLATKATKEGRVADLSPATLARELEADVASRMTRRDARKQPRQPDKAPQTPAQPAGGKQPAIETLSTRNLNGNGAPMPPANSDKERIQRAIAVGFKSR